MLKILRTVPLLLSALFLVRAHAVRANELSALFMDSVAFTNVGYASGSTVISNFPLRVDISSARPNGFDYDLAGFEASSIRFNFRDRFIDASTNAVIDVTVPYAVTNWNDDGVSTLYVQLPRFNNSTNAVLTMYWNPVDFADPPENDPSEVYPAVTSSVESVEWNRAIMDQSTNAEFVVCGPAYRRVRHGETWSTKLLNYWLSEPTISKREWKQGEKGAVINIGVPKSADPVVSIEYFDRNTSESLGEVMPLTPGSFRAVVTVQETDEYAELTKVLDFNIESAIVIGGYATTNDFRHRVSFSLADDISDSSLAACFNYKMFETKAKTDATKAVSAYSYKSEIGETSEVTLGCWFRMDPAVVGNQMSWNNRDKVQLVSLCSNGGSGPLAIVIDNKSATELTLRVQGVGKTDGSASYNSDLLPAKLCPEIGDGKWHFVMATRCLATGKICLYFDGELFNEGVTTAPLYAAGSENTLAIGCDPATPDDLGMAFVGQIAEVQVYNTAVDAETIKTMYGNRVRLTGAEDGLLAYFPLNDQDEPWSGSGAMLADKNKAGGSKMNITASGPLKWENSELPFRAGYDMLGGKPFLVKIAADSPRDFYFEDLEFGANPDGFYSDVRFFNEGGEPLDYVIDKWDIVNETYVWVKVPKYSPATQVIMCWGQGANVKLPENDRDSVWSAGTTEEQKSELRDYYLGNYDAMIKTDRVFENDDKILQNRWTVEPSMSMTQWVPGESAPVVNPGKTYGGPAKVFYYDRSTGKSLSSLPVSVVGEYRAIFRYTPSDISKWSSLEKSIDFRIVKTIDTHKLGDENARVLLANNDSSIPGAAMYTQGYDDNEDGWGVPYWTHHEADSDADVSDFDASKYFAKYNLFAGTHHEYMSGTKRIWGLTYVRFGNLFNNGKFHPGEQGDEGLNREQNYLPWNPQSERMLSYQGLLIGDYHRYAGTFLLQNVCDDRLKRYAQICSPCYEAGIGTVYFDVVNAFTDNVYDEDGAANYAIVVEVATNIVNFTEIPPVDGHYPSGIWSADDEEVFDAYRYADWHAVDMVPIRFRSDSGVDVQDCEQLPATKELELDITDGGSCTNFYRVYAPVNIEAPCRFRIRRTRIDRTASVNPDADAFIIVDNVICSPARDMVRLVPYGWYDPLKSGKQLLGQEMAFEPSFPGVNDAVYGRVRALNRKGDELAPGDVTAVAMHYRWKYLEQAETEWMIADFYPSTLRSIAPLVLPAGLPGDLEFWFEGSQNSGYYTYANYSGTKIGVPWYSEAFALVTNGWNGAEAEWSVRIREGRSDWESVVLVVRNPVDNSITNLEMSLVEDHQWRGYYMTRDALEEGVDVRVEFRNLEPSGTREWDWNTNSYYLATIRDLPYSGRMTEGGTNDWTRVPVDAYTGYLMFQADDSSKGLSIVRADYQNFNCWNDGHGTNEVFVGSAADDSMLPTVGVSPLVRDFYVDYTTNQTVSVSTNKLWSLDFETRSDYVYDKTFAGGSERVNGWILGKGRYVYGGYKMPGSGTAFQMSGGGEGYVELSDQSIGLWPRGIEKVTFNARLAQAIDFDDFSYYDDGRRMSNYVFTAHTCFDLDDNKSFTGDASLSLIAYYVRGTGCYEARWEQVRGSIDTAGAVIGPSKMGQKLSIYRWNRNGKGGYDQTLLYSVENGVSGGFDFDAPTSSGLLSSAVFMQMSLAVYNVGGDNMIVVGLAAAGSKASQDRQSDTIWRYAAFRDNSANKLKCGTYGVLTANSNGYFVKPRIAELNAVQPSWGGVDLPAAGTGNFKNSNKAYPTLAFRSCRDDIADGLWVAVPGRNEVFVDNDSSNLYGLRAADVCQTVDLWAGDAGGGGAFDDLLASFVLSNNWGIINSTEEFGAELPLVWRTRDAKLQLRTGGDLDDKASPGVVIDNVVVHQWRGRNDIVLYSGDSPDNPNDCKEAVNGDPDEFVFMSGWINGHEDWRGTAVELSARRTIPGRPAGIRTPLMDGLDGRGSGIGSIEFSYRNCQTNVALLVQVATNVFRGSLADLTKAVDTSDEPGSWSTVARLGYDDLGSSGSTNISFSLRIQQNGYGALARVILDPELVESVVTNSDPSAFGSVEITRVVCQDEPPIDKGCWWGWNVRTLGNDADSEKRMYLPDASEHPSVGYSLALNNSTTDKVVEGKEKDYKRHMPFLQSPTFTNNVIGEVSFRARKYSTSGYSQYAEVAVYGIKLNDIASGVDTKWQLLTRFVVSNTVFTTYSYRAVDDGEYAAIRLGVTGVKGVNGASRGPAPQCGEDPVRVLIDEVTISEAVNPELAIRNVGAFRYDMMASCPADNVPSKEQQPLCREGWGVQCELYAVMLEDQIDKRRAPKVKLYWYEGSDVWGFDKWRSLPEHHEAWLAQATDTDALIYRSSYDTAPEAVIPQSVKEGGISPVVQYMLEVFFYTIDPKTGVATQKSRLIDVKAGEWEVPSWYAPIDFNTSVDYGKGEHWSCFCILDDVAPGWAWINEVNIVGGAYDPSGFDVDQNCQFVEIAAPVTADLSGWRIEMVQAAESSGYILTNTVAVFGARKLSGTKSKNEISNYVFHVVANPPIAGSYLDRSILDADGALDGTWRFDDFGNGYLFNNNNTLWDTEPLGIRLVRPNGIVEHEVLTIGEDLWGGTYSPSNVCRYLNSNMKPGTFFYPGDDHNSGDHSVGVVNNKGECAHDNWNNTMMRTPGRINEGQQIDPDIPVPYGEMIYIYSTLDQSGGNIWQSNDGGHTFTNETLRFFIKRGSAKGTNLVYQVEPWYEVDYSRQTCDGKTTEFDVTNGFNRATRTVEVKNIGKGCSNSVSIVAKACVDKRLVEYGVDENNPYTPAIIRWLQDGSTLRGEFANQDGVIRLGEFWGRKSGYIADLTLTEMYWLDIDPTVGEMVLVGGWGRAPQKLEIPANEYHAALTNDVMSPFLMITNKTTDIASPMYAKAWAPYVLRSVEPTKTSWDYESGSTSDWNSVTFKIKGIINNGHNSLDNPDNWVDLRWFVFHEDSFHQPGNALGAEPYTIDVEILDPMHRHDSPGYDAGWVHWLESHPDRSDLRPYYRWDINTRLKPKEIEVLKTNNVTVVTLP